MLHVPCLSIGWTMVSVISRSIKRRRLKKLNLKQKIRSSQTQIIGFRPRMGATRFRRRLQVTQYNPKNSIYLRMVDKARLRYNFRVDVEWHINFLA